MPRFICGVNGTPSKIMSGVMKFSRSGDTSAVPEPSATLVTIFSPTHTPDNRDML